MPNAKIIFVSLFTIFFFISCKKEKPSTQTQELSAKQILLESIKEYNTVSFYNSTIQFNIGDLDYKMYRKNNIANFELIRKVDSTIYKSTYNNGSMSYFINDIFQEEIGISRVFMEYKLEGLIYLFSIPHSFNQNAARLKKLENVIINKKEYYAIHISFTKVPEDDPENEFILYINPDTFHVKYYAEKYNLSPRAEIIFKVAHNFRTIKEITFADYFVLTPKTKDIDLSEIYKLYNKRDLDELPPIEYKNISVELN